MDNFLYEDKKKYTFDDLNGVAGSSPDAMYGDQQNNQNNMNDQVKVRKEMERKIAEKFNKKQRHFISNGQNIMDKQKMINQNNGGQIALEDMNLDRGDHDHMDLNHHLGINSGMAGMNGIQLQAQNQYMGKETAQKLNYMTPEIQNHQQQQEQEIVKNNHLDDLDDLDEIEDVQTQPQFQDFKPPVQNYPGQTVGQTAGYQEPVQFEAQQEEFENQNIDVKLGKKKKKKKKKKQSEPQNDEQVQQIQQELELQQQQEQELERQAQQLQQEQLDLERQEYEEEQQKLAMQQQREVEETESKLREIQEKQEELEREQAKLEEIQRQHEIEEEEEAKRQQEEEEKALEDERDEERKMQSRKDKQKEPVEENKQSQDDTTRGAEPQPDSDQGSEQEDPGFLDDAPKYYQPGIIPQAPLKPSQKDAYDAFISKLFNPYLPLEEQRDLYMKPLPALIGQVQCTIERSKSGFDRLWPKYTLSLSNGNRYMLTGKKKGMNTTSHYMITIDQQKFQKDANGYLGKVRSNMLGTEFSIYDCKENPKKSGAGKEETRQQLGVVQYETNVLGSKGPRRMKVLLPMVSRDGQELYWPDTEVEKDTIQGKFADNETENIMFYFNKPPKWNEQVQAFVLNFNGRVDKASVKNFQLIDEYDDNKIYMQFGRVGKDAFNMDVAFPFSIFQAYAISLSSFDFKFACE